MKSNESVFKTDASWPSKEIKKETHFSAVFRKEQISGLSMEVTLSCVCVEGGGLSQDQVGS